jgi:hypothetical protein
VPRNAAVQSLARQPVGRRGREPDRRVLAEAARGDRYDAVVLLERFAGSGGGVAAQVALEGRFDAVELLESLTGGVLRK